MQGYDALWLPGMDHASIAVHALVEQALAPRAPAAASWAARRSSSAPGSGRPSTAARSWRRCAASATASTGRRERFTMDEGSNRAVRTMFKRLYDDGLIYRAERMVNWSPALRSVLSDIEVEHKEVDGELVSIRYGDGDDAIVVATTRVETMLGDTAVAVHPDDERYRAPGRHARSSCRWSAARSRSSPTSTSTRRSAPARSRSRPRTTPTTSRSAAGTACRCRRSWTRAAVITGTGTEFDGMDRFEARVAVREALRAQGRIVAEKRPYRHSVGHAQRAPTSRSSRGCRCSGSSRSGRWRRPRATRCGTGASSSTRRSWSRAGSTGWTTCTTGASPASCGGATASRSGTGPDGEVRLPRAGRGAARPAGPRTRTSSTPGSPPGCGRSPRWAGRTTPPDLRRSTRRRCWSPATTSCSSGSPG